MAQPLLLVLGVAHFEFNLFCCKGFFLHNDLKLVLVV